MFDSISVATTFQSELSELGIIFCSFSEAVQKHPYMEVRNHNSTVEHEATTSRIGEDQLLYCKQRGIDEEEAIAIIVNGFCKQVLNELPMEFAVEAQKLLNISLEGAIG